jgi:hypothetical protein
VQLAACGRGPGAALSPLAPAALRGVFDLHVSRDPATRRKFSVQIEGGGEAGAAAVAVPETEAPAEDAAQPGFPCAAPAAAARRRPRVAASLTS